MGMPDHLTYLLRNLYAGQKQQLELDMEQWTGQNWERSASRLYIVTPAYVTHMQSTSCEMLGWMNHKVESRLPGEISITSEI